MIRRIAYFPLIALLCLCACVSREERLTKAGNEVIKKIEHYRQMNGTLPKSLSDIGIKEKEEGPIYYEKRDSINYTVWFGTSIGESKIYYSDSNRWEQHLR